jgi:hypothetical protein
MDFRHRGAFVLPRAQTLMRRLSAFRPRETPRHVEITHIYVPQRYPNVSSLSQTVSCTSVVYGFSTSQFDEHSSLDL